MVRCFGPESSPQGAGPAADRPRGLPLWLGQRIVLRSFGHGAIKRSEQPL